MRYIISYQHPHQHYIDIEFIAGNISSDFVNVHLPAWRPGRYELGNFAKNIQKWAAYDEKGKALKFQKTSKDCWKVETKEVKELHVKYNYYGAELNAGSTYLDTKQLYMNPVNCCIYMEEKINESCTIDIIIPSNYKVATAIKKGELKKSDGEKKTATYITKDFHELADSPFIASDTLQHNMFVLDGVEFNLWFQGECKPVWPKLVSDFFIFINEQFVMMKEFPSESYHFIFQILPTKFYHGVEHLNSTVIALGPSYKLMGGELYDDLLGVSSHELFHSWNIKSIRPAEMHPYNYSKENYSRLGYVCEGVTTYYGDLLLYRSGVFSEFDYFKTVYERLQKHFDNFGRFNLSVADSSFDTWLDGYTQGIPNRKTSIYEEGCITAFMTDILIRKHTNNEKSLDDVMRYLYVEFSKKGKGYTESDYKGIVEHIANASFEEFFKKYIYGVEPYEPQLKECLDYIGCQLLTASSKKYYESFYGIKIADAAAGCKVSAVYPSSVADKAGLFVNDEIIAINEMPVKNDLAEWAKYFGAQKTELTVNSNGYIKKIIVEPTKEVFYKVYYISKIAEPSNLQKVAFKAWSKRSF